MGSSSSGDLNSPFLETETKGETVHLSLHAKMKELEQIGALGTDVPSLPDPIKGEGRWTYKGQPVEILSDYTGPAPDGCGAKFKDPHDVAWCPSEKLMLAFSASINERFVPLANINYAKGERLKIKGK